MYILNKTNWFFMLIYVTNKVFNTYTKYGYDCPKNYNFIAKYVKIVTYSPPGLSYSLKKP